MIKAMHDYVYDQRFCHTVPFCFDMLVQNVGIQISTSQFKLRARMARDSAHFHRGDNACLRASTLVILIAALTGDRDVRTVNF